MILSSEQGTRLLKLLDATIDVQDDEREAGRWRAIRNKVAKDLNLPLRRPGRGYAYVRDDPRQVKIPGA